MKRCEDLVRKFKEHGYKMTPQRRAILDAVARSSSHSTAEQIYRAVLDRMPDMSLATVYNTLRELVAIGEAFELDVGHGVRRYEIADSEHAHLVCINCGKIQDAHGDFSAVSLSFEDVEDFCPVRYVVTVYGYCAHCQAAEDA